MNPLAIIVLAAAFQAAAHPAVIYTHHEASVPLRLTSFAVEPAGQDWRPMVQGSGYVRNLDVSRKGHKKSGK